MNTQTRIGIVDPQEVVREGLSVLLNSYEDFSVVGQGKDIASARHLCSVHNPDLLITDFFDEGKICIDPLRKLQEEFPWIQLFILTNQRDKQIINEALKIGILGYWFKHASIGDLVKAIRSVRDNQPSLAPEVLRSILHTMVGPHQVGYDLTEREQEVLGWLVQGLSNREIADALFISYSTVKNHVSKILSKLEVSNRVEAVTLALENNLVQTAAAQGRA